MGQIKANVDHHCHLSILSVVDLGSFHSRILVPEKHAAQAVAHVEKKAQVVLGCLMLITFFLCQCLMIVSFSVKMAVSKLIMFKYPYIILYRQLPFVVHMYVPGNSIILYSLVANCMKYS